MVNSIRGTLTFTSTEIVGVDTGGVEWALEITASCLSQLPPLGSEVRLFTYLHHVQDSMHIYAFASQEERKLFLALLTVDGVGPSLARKILSGTIPSRFIAALESQDLETLVSIPGLGKKTAQKIVLKLQGKLTTDDHTETDANENNRELIASLTAMGFDAQKAGKALVAMTSDPTISKLNEQEREKEMLRRAIIALSS